MAELPERRILFVHAHPDDESINNGATMARYAAAGAHVALVTCTLGEEGEILVPELAQLEAAQADQLGGWRIAELRVALAALGVTDHTFLGGAGRFRDSGMIGTPANARDRAFWRADGDAAVFGAAVAELVAVLDRVRPQVLVTYDESGGYGHPDHIMAHRVAMAAVPAARHRVSKVYWNTLPASAAQVPGAGCPFQPMAARPALPDDQVTTVIRAPEQRAAKTAAMRAHATQLLVADEWFALSNRLGQPLSTDEYYRLVIGAPGGERDADGRETDLFGGIDG
ncbi:MAG TPA: N-acetyl-1-D-myo-inositol-2-amino-2-deoxy-alpha-D-glucopyranoside deacetylase [Jatrophihabitans sp.]|nr:N-acetyl-1-D-myo-inositol-2-amino-2-deoxy-alpha-D-glucopyranoside deacetylase [Jatrophihabitans sp.]